MQLLAHLCQGFFLLKVFSTELDHSTWGHQDRRMLCPAEAAQEGGIISLTQLRRRLAVGSWDGVSHRTASTTAQRFCPSITIIFLAQATNADSLPCHFFDTLPVAPFLFPTCEDAATGNSGLLGTSRPQLTPNQHPESQCLKPSPQPRMLTQAATASPSQGRVLGRTGIQDTGETRGSLL